MVLNQNRKKQLLGGEIARLAKNGQVLGLGSGTTAEAALEAIGERIKDEGLRIFGVSTSERSESLARKVGITVLSLGKRKIDWGFDGADEVEKGTLNLLKGGGGAMTREKIVAKKCRRWIVIVDQSKLVKKLGSKHPIPVEVKPEKMGEVRFHLAKVYKPKDIKIRQNQEGPGMYLTENGNRILDVFVQPGSIQPTWEKEWQAIPGVVGTGLFLGGYPDEVWVGRESGVIDRFSGLGRR